MFSSLDSGARGPGFSRPVLIYVVFLGKTLDSDSAPLSTQEYKWVQPNCQGNLTKCWGVTCNGLASHPGVAILLVT